jgi:hypothetical protein
MNPKIVDVKSIMEGPNGRDTLSMMVEVELDEGVREVWPFHYVPSDKAESTKTVTAWLAAHPDFPIGPRVVPMRPVNEMAITRRSIRLALVGLGLPADAVELALAESQPDTEREVMRAIWMEAQVVRRDDPIIVITVNYWRERAGIDEAMADKAWFEEATNPTLGR